MGARRLGLALTAAFLISVVVTSIFYVRIMRGQASSRPRFKRVLAAAVALPPGVPIQPDRIVEINWPEDATAPGLIENKEEVLGRAPVSGIAANELLLRR